MDQYQQLFRHIFRLHTGRDPERWESVLGVAMFKGKLAVKRMPSPSKAPTLWSVHQTVVIMQAALGQ